MTKRALFPEVPRLAQRAIQFSFRWQFAPALSRPCETPRWSTGLHQWQAARGPMDFAAWSVTLQRAAATTRPHRPSPVFTRLGQKHKSLHLDQSLHGAVGTNKKHFLMT